MPFELDHVALNIEIQVELINNNYNVVGQQLLNSSYIFFKYSFVKKLTTQPKERKGVEY